MSKKAGRAKFFGSRRKKQFTKSEVMQVVKLDPKVSREAAWEWFGILTESSLNQRPAA
jgi:hypothetical protein